MMMGRLLARLLFFAAAALHVGEAYEVVSLTVDNYVEKTDGKSLFVRYFAPWVSGNIWNWRVLVFVVLGMHKFVGVNESFTDSFFTWNMLVSF
jgi:hypothetical protein